MILQHWLIGPWEIRSPVNSPHKGQWLGTVMFSLICAWTDDWVNNRDAGAFRHHCAHYDVTVACNLKFLISKFIWRINVLIIFYKNQVIATRYHRWLVNIGSGNHFVPSDYITGTKVDTNLWLHMASLGHNDFATIRFKRIVSEQGADPFEIMDSHKCLVLYTVFVYIYIYMLYLYIYHII